MLRLQNSRAALRSLLQHSASFRPCHGRVCSSHIHQLPTGRPLPPSLPQKLATLTGHTMRVLYLAVSPDGQTIVTGGHMQWWLWCG